MRQTSSIHFLGQGTNYEIEPLILDQRVADILGWSYLSLRDPVTGPAQYDEYLHLAQELRDQWAPQEPLHVIEYSLFQASKTPTKEY